MISSTTGLGFAVRRRDFARSAIVSWIPWGIESAGKTGSSGTVVERFFGAGVGVEEEFEGGANGTGSINPVGFLLWGFGRGFLVVTAGSACVSPLDVDATALLAMVAVRVGGSDCGGLDVFCGHKRAGGSVAEGVRGRTGC